jgi:hypothetical protein
VSRRSSSFSVLAVTIAAGACSTTNPGPAASTDALATTSANASATPLAPPSAGSATGPSVTPPGPTSTVTNGTPAPVTGSPTSSPPTGATGGDDTSAVTDGASASADRTGVVAPVDSTGDVATDTGATSSSESVDASEGVSTVDENGDLVPPRALDVTATPGRHQHNFRAKTADPTVSYNDNDEIAIFDNRAAKLVGKLVLTFGGAGETKGNLTGGGEFAAKRGFHVLAVAAFQAYNIVDYGPDFFGEARRTVFEGVMHTHEDAFASITLTPADGVAQRTQKALEYLHATYPEEDWGYYLQADGSVRWSDVIFTGVSHGASNSARFASLVRASRVVAVAGPRDNLCARVDLSDCGGEVATWYSEVPKTPIDRYFTITGTGDDQHTQHLFAMEKLGYLGQPVRVDSAQPPYSNSHRLVHGGGHDDVCANASFQNLCNYAFGVPTENAAGTQ